MKKIYISKSEKETQNIGKSIVEKYVKKYYHTIFFLRGTFGSGKTVFVKGIASAINFDMQKIHSPSFVYITELSNKNFVLYHLDFYRVPETISDRIFFDHIEEVESIKRKKVVSCIEWSEKLSKTSKRRIYDWGKEISKVIEISFFIKKNLHRKIVVTEL